MKNCPRCNTTHPETQTFCPHDGAALVSRPARKRSLLRLALVGTAVALLLIVGG